MRIRFAGLVLLFVALPLIAHSAERTIDVIGEGSVEVAPDVAQVQIGVLSEAPTSNVALRENSQAMSRLLALLKQRGIADKDVQTQSFSVSPRYQHEPNKAAQLTGYQVVNQVQVRIGDLKHLGLLLDALVEEGANRVQGVHFTVGNPQQHADAARRLALADAQRKAQLYATAVGLKLGPVQRVEELGARPPVPRPMAMSAARADETVPVAPGQVQTDVSLRVVYEASIP